MRVLIASLAVVGLTQQALAADLGPILRGSDSYEPPSFRWGGTYAGLQAGYAIGSADFSNGTSSLIAFLLRDTILQQEAQVSQLTVLGKIETVRGAFGGFVGYNKEYEEFILGYELNYNRTALGASSADSLSRTFETSDGFLHSFTVSATSAVKVTDYGTIRARAGWNLGSFVPYAFGALAIGRADVTQSATVTDFAIDLSAQKRPDQFLPPTTQTAGQLGAFAYGYAAGIGVDAALTSNIFVRGEWEWLQFIPFLNQKVHINTSRVALGLRF